MVSDAAGNVHRDLLLRNFVGSGSNPLMRKDAIYRVGGYTLDPALASCEDWKLYLDLSERYEFEVVGEPLVGYRQRDDSMSANIMKMILAHKAILEDSLERHPELPGRIRHQSMCRLACWLISKQGKFLTSGESWSKVFGVIRQVPYLLLDPMFYWMIFRFPIRRPEQLLRLFLPGYSARMQTNKQKKRVPFPAAAPSAHPEAALGSRPGSMVASRRARPI